MRIAIRKVIADAIRKEVQTRRFYLRLAKRSKDPLARGLLEGLADEEARHVETLRGPEVEHLLASKPEPTQDLRIAEYLAPRRLDERSSFQDVLIAAMKREDASFWAYQAMAESAADASLRRVFRRLAEMERRHRNKLEKLYDDVVFRED